MAKFKASTTIIPAKTGKASNNRIAVTKIAHTNTLFLQNKKFFNLMKMKNIKLLISLDIILNFNKIYILFSRS